MLDVLLPGRCAGCGKGRWPFCEECAAAIGVITPPLCLRCGRPGEIQMAGCADCPPPSVHAARSPFLYAGPVARAVRAVKFSGWSSLAPVFAGAMAEALADALEGWSPRAISWVPLAPRRAAKRGYDQARLLAYALARILALRPVGLLSRVRETPPQARRGAEERRRALQGAFVARPSPPDVLLVDDVLTTGATAAACAEALARLGASRVVLVTAARSLGGRLPARCR